MAKVTKCQSERSTVQAMTRRELLSRAALGVLALAGVAGMAPAGGAHASELVAGEILETGSEADALWARAVAEAQAAGEPVVEGLTGNPEAAQPAASVVYTTGQASLIVYVNGFSDRVGAVAVYDVSTIISTVYNAYIYSMYGIHSVSNTTYSYTRIDGGRTLAVHYSCLLTNKTTGIAQVSTYYAEFYLDGSGWMSE